MEPKNKKIRKMNSFLLSTKFSYDRKIENRRVCNTCCDFCRKFSYERLPQNAIERKKPRLPNCCGDCFLCSMISCISCQKNGLLRRTSFSKYITFEKQTYEIYICDECYHMDYELFYVIHSSFY